jgi:hypothetical protein
MPSQHLDDLLDQQHGRCAECGSELPSLDWGIIVIVQRKAICEDCYFDMADNLLPEDQP